MATGPAPVPARPVAAVAVPATGAKQTSVLAILSLVLGLLSILVGLVVPMPGIVLAAVAVLFGHLARRQIRLADGAVDGYVLTSVGLIGGYVVLGFVALLFVFFGLRG